MTRRTWALVVLIVVMGRFVVLGAALAAEQSTLHLPASSPDTNGLRARVSDEPVLASLSSWDTVHYVDIASRGYSIEPVNGRFPNTVFFPLYPAMIRAIHDLSGLSWAAAAALVSNVAFALACVVIAKLSARVAGTRAALASIGLISLGPGSTAFSMGYSDSPFLLFTSLCLYAASRHATPAIGLTYALAAACRPTGILLGVPLLVNRLQRRESLRMADLWLLAGPAALLGVMTVQWMVVGDPLAFIHGQAAWAGLGASGIDSTPAPGVASVSDFGGIIGVGSLAVFIFYAASGVIQLVRGIPRFYGVFAVTGIAAALALGRLVSADRYLVGLFPLAWPVARLPVTVIGFLGVLAGVFLAVTSYATFLLELAP